MRGPRKFSLFVLGLGVGLALGVLAAPRRGSEVRKYLIRRGQDGANSAVDWIECGRGVSESASKLPGDDVTDPKGGVA